MFLIKSCPNCSKKIRFPIDKGEIKVKCLCGYSFIADPDNPETFINGQFDLSDGKIRENNIYKKLLKKIENIFYRELNFKSIINKFYDFRYKLQNFKLLPGLEQKKIIIKFILFAAAIIAVIFIINKFFLNRQLVV